MPQMKKGADGRYRTRIFLGKGEDGKKKYKSVYASSPVELKEKEAEVRHQLGKGLDLLAGRDSFGQWADDLLRLKEAANITERSKENYRHAVKVWKQHLAGYEISQVRADDIERLLVSLQERGYADRTVCFYQSVIRQIMRRAVGRVIPANPVDQVELTHEGTKAETRRALTDEEQSWIWNTPGRGQVVAIIMMLSGLRRGELAALTWADVDLKGKTITVNKTIEYPPNQPPQLRHLTKTAAGMRTVDISNDLRDYMATLSQDNDLVIHTQDGRVMTVSAWAALWNSYMRVLNIKYGKRTLADLEKMKRPGQRKFDMTIPHITLHWLRHTFCTIMYYAGVDVKTACLQMGHADVTTTLRIYTHLDALYQKKAVQKVDDFLAEQKKRRAASKF